MVWRPLKVKQWLTIGSVIDLGGRSLEIVHTLGHSPDSITLIDREAGIVFAADFIYLGPLYAQIPGADLSAYLASARRLVPMLGPDTAVFGAHGMPDEQEEHRAPRLGLADVVDLSESLEKLRTSGQQPRSWPVNARMSLLTWPPAFASWQG